MTVDALKLCLDIIVKRRWRLVLPRWQTIYKVVLRAAVPGILTAVVFGMARAFGEDLSNPNGNQEMQL